MSMIDALNSINTVIIACAISSALCLVVMVISGFCLDWNVKSGCVVIYAIFVFLFILSIVSIGAVPNNKEIDILVNSAPKMYIGADEIPVIDVTDASRVVLKMKDHDISIRAGTIETITYYAKHSPFIGSPLYDRGGAYTSGASYTEPRKEDDVEVVDIVFKKGYPYSVVLKRNGVIEEHFTAFADETKKAP